MNGSRMMSLLSSLLCGAVVYGWTATVETSNPLLSARDLPQEILGPCNSTSCAKEDEFRSNWIGRTARGNLFVVSNALCAADACLHWLVEKNDTVARVLLDLPGSFRFHRVTERYPDVEVRTRNDDEGFSRARFEWDGKEYTRVSVDPIYEVNGQECGTREECYVAAERAFKEDHVDQALRIWQKVHGVSWI